MESFKQIYQRASERKGGKAALEALLPSGRSHEEIAALGDDRLLSAMSMQVMKSGFVWRVVDNKWPAYEEAFFGFVPFKVLMMSPEQLSQRASDPNLIRHAKKTQAIYDNALMVQELADKHGSFARFVADWPEDNIIGLWAELKKRGTRLGGNTGPYFLRTIGKDTFLLTGDVESYFKGHKLLDASATSKKGMAQIQAAFNQWQQESGRSLAEISRILACGVGDNFL